MFFLNKCPEISDNQRAIYNENINLLNCIFNRMIINGKGGAISIDNAPCSINLESSNFFECKCTEKGGAIYFLNGQDVKIDKVCAILCMAGNGYSGHYGFFQFLTNSYSFVSYLTVTKCSNSFNGYSPIEKNNGNLKLQNINFSRNQCLDYSINYITYQQSLLIKFSNFVGNEASQSDSRNFCFLKGKNSQILEYSNIIANKAVFILFFDIDPSSFYLRNSIIQYNLASEGLFFQYSRVAYLYILDCVIIHSGSYSGGYTGYISISPYIENKFTNTYSLVHYQTQFEINNNKIICIAQNPIPDRTPIQTIIETPFKTPQITTPLITPKFSPQNTTPQKTPVSTFQETPIHTPFISTPLPTPQISPIQTLKETPIQSPLISTPIPTPELSPIPTTLPRTPIISPIETLSISRSLLIPTPILTQTNQLNQEDNSIFSSPFFYIILNLLFLIIIIIIILIFLNNKFNKKESSSGKKENKKNIINNDLMSTNPYSQFENQFGIQKNLI